MHLPAAVRRRILYATAAVLVAGGLVISAQPAPQVAAGPAPDFAGPANAERIANEFDTSVPTPAAAVAAPARAKAVMEARPKSQTYRVAAGDTVGTIAERFGLKSQTVLSINDLSEDDTIKIGQDLTIPAVDGIFVKVRSGDTLYDIADNWGVTVDDIVKANSDVDPNALKLDQTLLLPGAKSTPRHQVASRASANRPNVSQKLDFWPAVGPLTDFFGWRIHPVYGTRHYHDGLDIGVRSGTPVRAASGGTVTMASRYGGYGLAIKIDHGGGILTLYAHMSELDVAVGDTVKAGQHIGYSGNTGTSTGPHLHFTVMVGSTPVDPRPWLP